MVRGATGTTVIMLALIGLCLLVTLGCSTQMAKPKAHISILHPGLEQFEARNFDVAFLRPDVDFAAYKGVLLDAPELAFKMPDRSQQEFALNEEQRNVFRQLLTDTFAKEFVEPGKLFLAQQAGPDVLRLKVRVQDISATILQQGVGNAGRASIGLRAEGDVTLVLELRDSQSEKTLAIAADRRGVEGVAVLQAKEAVTSWSEVNELCKRWAEAAKRGLNNLVGDDI